MDTANFMTQNADNMTDQPDQYPAEVQELIAEIKANRLIKIEAIGKEVAKKRDEAVNFRKASGIEEIWTEDEEYYEGIDDGNRDATRYLKSSGTDGGISKSQPEAANRCTSFFNITRQFVDSAAARMGDILLPAGDWNFQLKPTPVPEPFQPWEKFMPQKQEAATPAAAPTPAGQPGLPQAPAAPQGAPVPQAGAPGAAPQPQAPQTQPTPEQLAVIHKLAMDHRVELAETQIRDWLVQCRYHAEARKVIETAAKIGTGILKGPFAERRVRKALSTENGRTKLVLDIATEPGSKAIDPRDFFPDPACGDNIHNGSYVLERDRMSAKQLMELKELKGYLPEQIDQVLDEGPDKKNYDGNLRTPDSHTDVSDIFEVWYYQGLVATDSLSAMSVSLSSKESEKKKLPAVVVLVNDTPIKAYINPIDTGAFQYDLMPWQRRTGSPWGIGVARQGRTAQSMFNSSARSLMDNAGLGSGPQIIVRQGAIFPADGIWQITPRKIWFATEQADMRSVADAFVSVNIPMVQQELNAIMEQARKMMEESTGIFFIMQGQQGSAPDTVGGMELLHKNASAVLRRLARVYDECITEPHMTRYYEWLMAHGPEECKGDMTIEAVGSTALVEREIQVMWATQMLQLSLNPAFGLDPEKAMMEVLKAQRFIPDKFTMDADKKAKLANQQPTIPAIEVAKIRAQSDKEKLAQEKWAIQVQTTEKMHRSEVDTDRDRVYAESMASRDITMAQLRREELQQKKELALLQYANTHSITLDKIKADLAKTSMTLREQRALASMSAVHAAPQVAEPAVEPPQHAPDGQAFQQ